MGFYKSSSLNLPGMFRSKDKTYEYDLWMEELTPNLYAVVNNRLQEIMALSVTDVISALGSQ